MENLKINRKELVTFCEVIPAGITKIIELQKDGFAYIKP
jgi:intracellular sulfur oxidation DsrE/DsrF family protein